MKTDQKILQTLRISIYTTVLTVLVVAGHAILTDTSDQWRQSIQQSREILSSKAIISQTTTIQ